jgi:hypothetical protein
MLFLSDVYGTWALALQARSIDLIPVGIDLWVVFVQ